MMKWTMKWTVAVLIAALIMTAGTTAIAQPTPETLYTEGQTAYERGDYGAAITKWQAAYDLSKENGLLFNLAQAKRLAGDCAGALTSYRNFVARDSDPTSDQHKLAGDFAQELASQCSEAPVTNTPSTTNSVAPAPPKVAEISLPAVRERRDEIPVKHGRNWKMAGLVTSGVGVVTLAIGLGLGHHGSEIGAEVTAACRTSCDWSALKDKDIRGRREVAIGRVLDVAGAAAIVGGAVFYYIGMRQESVTIAPRDGGAVVSWRGS